VERGTTYEAFCDNCGCEIKSADQIFNSCKFAKLIGNTSNCLCKRCFKYQEAEFERLDSENRREGTRKLKELEYKFRRITSKW